MNRGLRRGVIGLSFAWLLDCNQADNKDEHDVMKEIISSREMFDRRQDCRNLFKAFADDAQYPSSQMFRTILDHESELRGGDESEPAWLRCTPCALSKALQAGRDSA